MITRINRMSSGAGLMVMLWRVRLGITERAMTWTQADVGRAGSCDGPDSPVLSRL
jgi:hypothetical protein